MKLSASRVLLVEDDPRMPDILAALLRADLVTLETAVNAPAALALAGAQTFDLILLDLGLPQTDGFSLLQQLKDDPRLQDIPVIVLTAYNSTTDKLRGFELGAVDYVTKPYEAAELRARVRSALRTKQLQDQLTQSNRELLAARVAAETAARAKADFLAHMSHEIRTPMNGVISMASLLLETALTSDQRSCVETIHNSGEVLLTLINDILDISKIESGKVELERRALDLRSAIEETLDLLAAKAAEKQLDLAYQFEDGVPTQVLGDVTRLRQVLVNLIGNAIKFTEKGEVVVEVKPLAPPPTGDQPWHLQFSVRDTGIGIPADRLSRLFHSFSQADVATTRKYGGTGLGLSISKRLVEIMEGKMWVESVAQQGSTFHFTLSFAAAPDAGQPKLDERRPQLADLRLLIVDDNATNCRILSLQTGKWGMLPRTSQTANQALEWLRAGEKFDLAILDMQMPGMDGLMLANEIRRLPGLTQLPLVLLTSMGVRTDAPEFSAAAFASCLTKPLKPAQLHEVLTRVVSGPRAAAPRKAQVATKLDATLALRLPLRMLLCDDNAINQKVATRLLQQMGYKPDIAGNGREALAAIDRQSYDLIFMDVQMPEMDGMEATRHIRERQRDRTRHPNYKSTMIIVAMTANAMAGDREKCLDGGMDDYLAKPVRPDDVRKIIERWGAAAATVDAPAANAAQTTTASTGAPEADAPVDMDRLNDFTNGNAAELRELITLYLTQTSGQIRQLNTAVQTNAAPEVRRVAHSCAGASATCGMVKIVPFLRELEHQGEAGQLTTAPELARQVQQEFERIRVFLEKELSKLDATPAPA